MSNAVGMPQVEILDWEVKQGIDGSGRPVFFLHWSKPGDWRNVVEVEGLDSPFGSEGEAVANAKCQTRCGKRIA